MALRALRSLREILRLSAGRSMALRALRSLREVLRLSAGRSMALRALRSLREIHRLSAGRSMAVANSARKKAGGGGKFKSGSTSESACGESRNLVCFPMSRREGRKPGPTRRKKQHTASRRSPESLEHSSLNGTKQGCAPLERVSFRVFKQGFPRSPGEDTDRGALPS